MLWSLQNSLLPIVLFQHIILLLIYTLKGEVAD